MQNLIYLRPQSELKRHPIKVFLMGWWKKRNFRSWDCRSSGNSCPGDLSREETGNLEIAANSFASGPSLINLTCNFKLCANMNLVNVFLATRKSFKWRDRSWEFVRVNTIFSVICSKHFKHDNNHQNKRASANRFLSRLDPLSPTPRSHRDRFGNLALQIWVILFPLMQWRL